MFNGRGYDMSGSGYNGGKGYTGYVIGPNTGITQAISYSMVSSAINLSKEKIVKGNTILGIEGVFDGVVKLSSSYSVDAIDGQRYGFTKNNSTGYWVSQNKGYNNSYAICRINFNAVNNLNGIRLNCINYAESNYDFGLISKIDTTLSRSNSEDSNAYYSFKGKSSSSVQYVDLPTIPAGEHFIEIKYRKDSSQSTNNDNFQFKFEIFPYGLHGIAVVSKDELDSYNLPDDSWGLVLEEKILYHKMNGIWTIDSRIDTTDATAISSDIIEGKTAYINNEKITGTLSTETMLTNGLNIKLDDKYQSFYADMYPNGSTYIPNKKMILGEKINSMFYDSERVLFKMDIIDHEINTYDIIVNNDIRSSITYIGTDYISKVYYCMDTFVFVIVATKDRCYTAYANGCPVGMEDVCHAFVHNNELYFAIQGDTACTLYKINSDNTYSQVLVFLESPYWSLSTGMPTTYMIQPKCFLYYKGYAYFSSFNNSSTTKGTCLFRYNLDTLEKEEIVNEQGSDFRFSSSNAKVINDSIYIIPTAYTHKVTTNKAVYFIIDKDNNVVRHNITGDSTIGTMYGLLYKDNNMYLHNDTKLVKIVNDRVSEVTRGKYAFGYDDNSYQTYKNGPMFNIKYGYSIPLDIYLSKEGRKLKAISNSSYLVRYDMDHVIIPVSTTESGKLALGYIKCSLNKYKYTLDNAGTNNNLCVYTDRYRYIHYRNNEIVITDSYDGSSIASYNVMYILTDNSYDSTISPKEYDETIELAEQIEGGNNI